MKAEMSVHDARRTLDRVYEDVKMAISKHDEAISTLVLKVNQSALPDADRDIARKQLVVIERMHKNAKTVKRGLEEVSRQIMHLSDGALVEFGATEMALLAYSGTDE